MNKITKQKLVDRTCKIIEKNGTIVLRSIKSPEWYLGCWTNIAAGPDKAHWACKELALPIFCLEWAFAIAKLYECKVVTIYK